MSGGCAKQRAAEAINKQETEAVRMRFAPMVRELQLSFCFLDRQIRRKKC
jgi:hypothetical protein